MVIEIKGKVLWNDPLSDKGVREFEVEGRGSGIFVLKGPNAVGKTTFLKGISYALGDPTYRDELEQRRGCRVELDIAVGDTRISVVRDPANYVLEINDIKLENEKEIEKTLHEFFDVMYVPVERLIGAKAITKIITEFRNTCDQLLENIELLSNDANEKLKELRWYKSLDRKIKRMSKNLKDAENKLHELEKRRKSNQELLKEFREYKSLLEILRKIEKWSELKKKYVELTEIINQKMKELEKSKDYLKNIMKEVAIEVSALETRKKNYEEMIKETEDKLRRVNEMIERKILELEKGKSAEFKELANALRKENEEIIERFHKKALLVLRKMTLSGLKEEEEVLTKIWEACRSAANRSIKLHGLGLTIEEVALKARKGLEEVRKSLRDEEKKLKEWMKLKNESKVVLDLLRTRMRLLNDISVYNKELKEIETKLRIYEISKIQEKIPPDVKKKIDDLNTEIEKLNKERLEISREIDEIADLAAKKDELLSKAKEYEKILGVSVDVSIDEVDAKILELEEEIEKLEKEIDEINSRVTELRGKISSLETILQGREKYIDFLLKDEAYITELQKILSNIKDSLRIVKAEIGDRRSEIDLNRIKTILGSKELNPKVAKVLKEAGKLIAELMGGIWDPAYNWLKVKDIDFEQGIVILEAADGKTMKRGISDFSRGQLGLASILPLIHKPTEAKYGKIILIDEIGDLDPDRRREIVDHLKKRKDIRDLCFAILVLPDIEVKMIDVDENPDAIR